MDHTPLSRVDNATGPVRPAPDTPEIAAEMRLKAEEARKRNKRVVLIEKMVTKREAIQLYSNARVFCCPSVY